MKVGRLAEKFGESYKLLAYHAALPLLLTPELLNYLRNKFLGDKVPWVAEVDLLLSDLCKEVAYEQFAMDSGTRAYLLAEADEKLGRPHMQDVARLLIRYVRSLSDSASAARMHQLQSQRWAAMVYLDEQREIAVREIAESFLRSMMPVAPSAGGLRSSLIDESELARLTQITQMLAPELEASRELVEYAAEVSRILTARGGDAQVLEVRGKPARVADVMLPAPAILLRKTNTGYETEEYVGYDVFISYVGEDVPFLTEYLLPRLNASGLIYTMRDLDSYGDSTTQLADLKEALINSRYVLFLMNPRTPEIIGFLYDNVFSGVPDHHELENKILLGFTRPVAQTDQLSALKIYSFYGPLRHIEDELKLLLDRLRGEDAPEEYLAPSSQLLIGAAPAFRRVLDMAMKVAPTQATVLIKGEVGTGKQLLAHAIHEHSQRTPGQFIVVNSENIPPELLESELFGHVRGAFTGAVAAKKGLFQVADGGTIFFDEIGHMPAQIQAQVLRFMETGEFRPLGDKRSSKVDVRVITSTSIDLSEAVRKGMFRGDLYYRVSAVTLELPPLRKRRQDILPLAQHFIRKYNEENGRLLSEHLDPEIRALLQHYQWPGNVRELENAIERAVVIAPGNNITRECLPADIAAIPKVVRKGFGERVYISYPVDKFDQREFALRVSDELRTYCEAIYLERSLVKSAVIYARPLEDADIFIALLSTSVSKDTYFVEEIHRAVQLAKSRGSRPTIVPVCHGQAKDLPRHIASLFPHKLLEEWQWVTDPSQLVERILPLILRGRGRTKNNIDGSKEQADETKTAMSPKWMSYYWEYEHIASSGLPTREKIMRAFSLLEGMVREAGRDFNVPWYEHSSPARIVRALARQRLLTEKEQSDFIEMWSKRNRLMHLQDITVDETDLIRTLGLLKNLVRAFG